jgi:3-hydroxybutyryl-CoA dehydrogenase
MKLGMAHPMGPLELADFIGLDVCLSILEVMYKGFKKEKYAPNALLTNMVQAGKLGKKTSEGFYNYFNNKKAKIPSDQFL